MSESEYDRAERILVSWLSAWLTSDWLAMALLTQRPGGSREPLMAEALKAVFSGRTMTAHEAPVFLKGNVQTLDTGEVVGYADFSVCAKIAQQPDSEGFVARVIYTGEKWVVNATSTARRLETTEKQEA